jgi:hypothetical protein
MLKLGVCLFLSAQSEFSDPLIGQDQEELGFEWGVHLFSEVSYAGVVQKRFYVD